MEIQLYDGATNGCCDGLATRRYKSKRGSLFRYWAQRERGLKKKKKKKKGSNLNLGGRRTRVQTSILGEEEGSELESRGEEKKGPKWNLRERRRRVRTRLAGEEEGFELESRGEDDSDKAVYQVYGKSESNLAGSLGGVSSFSCIPTTNHPYSCPSKILLKINIFSMISCKLFSWCKFENYLTVLARYCIINGS